MSQKENKTNNYLCLKLTSFFLLLSLLTGFAFASTTYADTIIDTPINFAATEKDGLGEDFKTSPRGDCNNEDLTKDCATTAWIRKAINVLSAIVGIVVVIMIIVGGIEYSSAGNNPQQMQAAKSKVINAVLAFIIFIFMYAFLQWIVPGGIF